MTDVGPSFVSDMLLWQLGATYWDGSLELRLLRSAVCPSGGNRQQFHLQGWVERLCLQGPWAKQI